MIYTAIDTFYLNDEQLKNSPSRKDGIDEETETTLRIYGCDLIQESGILLRLPQAVMATGQVLFHRFYCKKSFARFSVKRVAASCVWLASKLEESPRKAKHVIIVFHRMECRRENLPIEHLDVFSKKYSDLKNDLIRTERHLLKEMGFICHVEHPHKFISNYLATLGTPLELRQEAWNLANDRDFMTCCSILEGTTFTHRLEVSVTGMKTHFDVPVTMKLPEGACTAAVLRTQDVSHLLKELVRLRTTLCVRFKSEVVACGVVYAAARRFQVPLPEDPPWWTVFDADEAGIQEVCRVLAQLYSLHKAQYIPVYKDNDSFTMLNKTPDTQAPKESPNNGIANDSSTPMDTGASKDALVKAALDKLKESKKSEDDGKNVPAELDGKEDLTVKSKSDHKLDANIERGREREKERSRGRDRDSKGRESDRDSRGRDSDREREREREIDRDREKERRHRSKDKSSGHSDKSRHHSSRDRSDYHSSHSSRDKDRHRHHQ